MKASSLHRGPAVTMSLVHPELPQVTGFEPRSLPPDADDTRMHLVGYVELRFHAPHVLRHSLMTRFRSDWNALSRTFLPSDRGAWRWMPGFDLPRGGPEVCARP